MLAIREQLSIGGKKVAIDEKVFVLLLMNSLFGTIHNNRKKHLHVITVERWIPNNFVSSYTSSGNNTKQYDRILLR